VSNQSREASAFTIGSQQAGAIYQAGGDQIIQHGEGTLSAGVLEAVSEVRSALVAASSALCPADRQRADDSLEAVEVELREPEAGWNARDVSERTSHSRSLARSGRASCATGARVGIGHAFAATNGAGQAGPQAPGPSFLLRRGRQKMGCRYMAAHLLRRAPWACTLRPHRRVALPQAKQHPPPRRARRPQRTTSKSANAVIARDCFREGGPGMIEPLHWVQAMSLCSVACRFSRFGAAMPARSGHY
jgi:hypothetical protein